MSPPHLRPFRPRWRVRLAPLLAGGALLATACSGDRTVTIPSAPTFEAAAGRAGGAAATVVAAASPVATSAAQVGGTAITQAGPAATSAANLGATAVSAAGPAATSATTAGATIVAGVPPAVTRVATAYAQAAASADARTPLNGANGLADATARPTGSATSGSTSVVIVPVASATGTVNAGATPTSSGSPVRIAGAGLVAAHPALSLQNTTDAAVDLSGWRVRVGDAAVAVPPNTRIEPRGLLTLHLADGGSRGADVYLGRDSADLLRGLRPGERVIPLDAAGRTVSEIALPQL